MTTPQPTSAPTYELPGARALVSRGFDLTVAASRQIRQASVYIGLLVLLVVGPTIIFASALIAAAPEDIETFLADIEALGEALQAGAEPPPELAQWFSVVVLLFFVGVCALVGVIAVSIEAQIMAVALLGGQLAGRPLSLREALLRSRQTFWRLVRASILVAIPVYLTQAIFGQAMVDANLPEEGSGLLGAFVGAVVGTPFGYVPSAIVLGDVGAREALARSVRLAQARWWLALVVALFPAVFSSVQIMALGAGGDVIARFAEAANLGFDSGVAQSVVTILVILAAIAAIGSLIFTMSAVLVAPQVVAFVGLTHYVAGLDKARVPAAAAPAAAPAAAAEQMGGFSPMAFPPPPPPPGSAVHPAPPSAAVQPGPPATGWTLALPVQQFRWVSRAMLAGFVGMAVLAGLGILMIAGLPSR